MAACIGAKIYVSTLLLSILLKATYADTSEVNTKSVLSSIQLLLKYYQNDYKNLNLDGFFGLRVLEGQLQLLISEHSLGRHKHLSNETLAQIIALKKASTNLTDLGLEVIKRDDAQYFNKFNPIVSKPWKIIKHHRKLNPSLRWEIPQYKAKLRFMRKNFTEATSDKCMTEVMSSDNKSCVLSDMCVKLMTSRGFTGYPLTHQLLWSMLVERKPQCVFAVQPYLQKLSIKSIDELQLEFCTNNFYEMVAVVEVLMHGSVHGSQQDLFLEQQFVCPSIGFYEFLKKDYVKQIISWQFPSGCFGELEENSEEYDSDQIDLTSLLEEYNGDRLKFVPEVTINHFGSQGISREKSLQKHLANIKQTKLSPAKVEQQKPLIASDVKPQQNVVNKMSILKPNPQNLVSNTVSAKQMNKIAHRPDIVNHDYFQHQIEPVYLTKVGRRLLVEKKMSGGCLSHKTGVAAGALVMYLRYMIDPGNIKWEGQHDLLLSDTRSLLQVNGESKDLGEDGNQEEMDNPEADEENMEDEMEEGEVMGYDTKDTGEQNKEIDVLKNAKPIPPSVRGVENKDSVTPYNPYKNDAIPDNPRENENYENEDEDNGDEDIDETEDDKQDENHASKEEYDTDGNPVAPKGRILEDNGGENFFPESFLEKHVDIHADRPGVYHDIQAEEPLKSFQEIEDELKDVITASHENLQEEEEDHIYDDEIVEEENGHTIKPKQAVATPHPSVLIQEPQKKIDDLGTPASVALYHSGRDQSFPERPNYTVLMLVSVAPLFILLFFLFKFVKKRRVYIRYHF